MGALVPGSESSAEERRQKRLQITPIKYDYQRGTTIFCSARETLVCEVFLKTRNLQECVRQTVAQYGGKLSVRGIQKWLRLKPHMMSYLNKRMGELADWNMTPEEYFAKLRRYAEGVEKADKSQQFFWKLLGEAKGWLKAANGGAGNTTNLQINMLQANGQQ